MRLAILPSSVDAALWSTHGRPVLLCLRNGLVQEARLVRDLVLGGQHVHGDVLIAQVAETAATGLLRGVVAGHHHAGDAGLASATEHGPVFPVWAQGSSDT